NGGAAVASRQGEIAATKRPHPVPLPEGEGTSADAATKRPHQVALPEGEGTAADAAAKRPHPVPLPEEEGTSAEEEGTPAEGVPSDAFKRALARVAAVTKAVNAVSAARKA